MKTKLCVCICALVLWIAILPAENITAVERYREAAAKLETMIRHTMLDNDLPAVSIALVDDQKVVWAQGFGFADPARKVAADADTVYRVGSVSKLFTDVAIMQRVENGSIDLNAPIGKYLSNLHPSNPFGKPITLRELMSHRSGLLREPPVGHYFDSTDPSLEATVESLNSTALVYAPGSHAKYSNAALAVVGYVLQSMSGQPFTTYVQNAVLRPLGMNDSSFAPNPEILKRLARSYIWTYDGRIIDAPTFQLGMAPAGCMYSSVVDLSKFLSMLFAGGQGTNGRVLKSETLRQMWEPQFPEAGSAANYGIGFRLSEREGHRVIGHGGAIYGFATELEAMPDDKLGVAVVTTMDSANAITNKIAAEALRLMLDAKTGKPLPELAETTPVPPDEARRLAGKYGSDEDAVDLIEQNGKLFMLPEKGGYQVELRKRESNLIAAGKLGSGLEVHLSDRVPVPIPPAPTHDWDGLIGEYGWDYDTLYILERGGHLTSLIEWYEYEPLDAVSRDVFRYPKRGLYDGETLTFTRDASGKATEVRVGAVVFKRRPLGPTEGGIFRIQPVKPVNELRKEALAAHPPEEKGDFRAPDLVELTTLDPTIKLDIRYATTNDFLSAPVYLQAKAYMQRPAAEAVVRANQELHKLGYGLLIHDSYRPWYVTKMFWDATPEDKHIFVANPAEGSRHNRGCAVDLTMYELSSGKPVEMVGVYDEMSPRSYPFYPGGTSRQRWLRTLLRHEMEKQGFQVFEWEWWHFDYKDWKSYPILNLTFEELSKKS